MYLQKSSADRTPTTTTTIIEAKTIKEIESPCIGKIIQLISHRIRQDIAAVVVACGRARTASVLLLGLRWQINPGRHPTPQLTDKGIRIHVKGGRKLFPIFPVQGWRC